MRHAAAIVALLLAVQLTSAQVLIKPKGENGQPLVMKSLKIATDVEGQIAATEMELVFSNPVRQEVEADFIYTLLPEMHATFFAYYYGEERVIARIVEKERAREIYQHITSRMRDPALIELVGKRTFRAKIFPVLPDEDLKVQMHFVQVLPSNKNGYSLELPIAVPKGEMLEEIDVSVRVKPGPETLTLANNYGLTNSDPMQVELKGNKVRPAKNLRVQVNRDRKPLGVSCYSARSGGAKGYFALTLTPNRGMQTPQLKIIGIRTDSVSPLPRKIAAGQAVLVTGRYDMSGTATVTLLDKAGSFKANVDFAWDASANNPATKLWAAHQIESGTNAKTVMALSHRFGLPSKFTSWLAIPEEERKRYKQEIEWSKLTSESKKVAEYGIRHGLDNPTFKKRKRALEARAKAAQLPADYLFDEAFSAFAEERARVLVDEIRRGRIRSSAYRRARADLDALERHKILVGSYYVESALASQLYEQAQLLAKAESMGGQSARVRQVRQHMDRMARAAKLQSDQYIHDARVQLQYQLADEFASLDVVGANKPRQRTRVLAALNRLRAAGGSDWKPMVEQAKLNRVHTEGDLYWRTVGEELTAERFDSPRLKDSLAKLKAIEAKYRVKDALGKSYYIRSALRAPLDRYSDQVISSGHESAEAISARAKLDQAASALGTDTKHLIREHFTERARWIAMSINGGESIIPRNRFEVEGQRAELRRLVAAAGLDAEAFLKEGNQVWGYPNNHLRRPILDEMRKTTPDRKKVEQLLKDLEAADRKHASKEWAQARGERILTELELERLQDMPVTPEIERQRQELTKKRDQLKARMGDPLIVSDAPADARQVVAIMPDGRILPMTFESALGRWQARFDIPPGAALGEYKVQIIAVLASGRRTTSEFTYDVDYTPPKALARAIREGDRTRLELSGVDDIARVEVLLPNGGRISLKWNGRLFTALTEERLARGETLSFVVYDRAHNRTVVEARVE